MVEANRVLLKMFEANDVLKDVPQTKDYVLEAGEKWWISSVGISSTGVSAEVEITASFDGGVSWINPYDATNDFIFCLTSDGDTNQFNLAVPLEFTGDGANVIIRFKVKNHGIVPIGEVVGFVNGWIDWML